VETSALYDITGSSLTIPFTAQQNASFLEAVRASLGNVSNNLDISIGRVMVPPPPCDHSRPN